MATLIIPSALRRYTDEQAEVTTFGETVLEGIENVISEFPALRDQLMDDHGKLRRFVRVFVGEDDVPLAELQETNLSESSVVTLIPAIAGG